MFGAAVITAFVSERRNVSSPCGSLRAMSTSTSNAGRRTFMDDPGLV